MSDLEAKEVIVSAKEYYDMRHELCEYHMLEEELGIDLITLFKFLTAKECYEKNNGDCYVVGISTKGIILMPKWCPYGESEFTRSFKNYGKTWALTKEELK